ncbi:MAG: YnbE family lipoprotein [Rickettsiales bacterium]
MSKNAYLVFLLPFFTACQPTVKVEAPDKPIEINLNVNIKLEIQKDVKQAIAKNKDIF